jgi:hypothetical protein
MRRLARWLMARIERDRYVPRRLEAWTFDYTLDRGTPVRIEVNPQPKTWASGSAVSITYPLSPDNPYGRRTP